MTFRSASACPSAITHNKANTPQTCASQTTKSLPKNVKRLSVALKALWHQTALLVVLRISFLACRVAWLLTFRKRPTYSF